jgi:hypothetical protein
MGLASLRKMMVKTVIGGKSTKSKQNSWQTQFIQLEWFAKGRKRSSMTLFWRTITLWRFERRADHLQDGWDSKVISKGLMDGCQFIESSGIKKNRGNRRPTQLHWLRKLAVNQRLIRNFLTWRNTSSKHPIVVEFWRNGVEWGVLYRAWRYHVVEYIEAIPIAIDCYHSVILK